MRLFIDSADPDDIRWALENRLVQGITTNPSLVSKVSGSPEDVMDGAITLAAKYGVPVSIEPQAETIQETIEKVLAYQLPKIGMAAFGVTMKLPVLPETIKHLGGRNATCIFSAAQAVIAANAGARYVSFFWCRMNDFYASPDAAHLEVSETRTIFDRANKGVEIIAGSIRTAADAGFAWRSGAHIVTTSRKVIEEMLVHEGTQASVDGFLRDYKGQK